MTRIEIISGTYGYRPSGSKHPSPIDRGGVCDVTDEEAQRLFTLGVARPAATMPASSVATDDMDANNDYAVPDMPAGEDCAHGIHLDPEQLQTMTNAALRDLACEMGVDTSKLKTKTQLIDAIAAVQLEEVAPDADEDADDGDALPALEPGAPVV